MLQSPSPNGSNPGDRVTVGVAARLSRYLQVLTQAHKMGKERISSQEIADYTNINATQIRRDADRDPIAGVAAVGGGRLQHHDPLCPINSGLPSRCHKLWSL